jgi:glycosyltransferase involved in cell wall biosynthesis
MLTPSPAVDVVIPVHNSQETLEFAVGRLNAYLMHEFPFSARITIADGASTDSTLKIASQLAAVFPNVRVKRMNKSGRGQTLAAAWLTSDARVVAQMDVDLTSALSSFLPLVAPIVSGSSDVSIDRQSTRGGDGALHEAVGRLYSLVLPRILGVNTHRFQYQIRALRADVARRILPTVVHRGPFFDLELGARAERSGLRLHALPFV